MRKSRVTVTDLEEQTISAIKTNPLSIFGDFEKLEIDQPVWSKMMLFFLKKDQPTLDISFFEEPKDFFVWYSKLLISKGSNISLHSFTFENGEWKSFSAP